MVYNILGFVPSAFQLLAANDDDGNDEVEAKEEIETKKKVKKSQKKEEVEPPKSSTTFGIVMSLAIKAIFVFLSYQLFLLGAPEANTFYKTSHAIAKQLASPTIVMKGTLQSGETVLVDDYRECYHWIRDNTPQCENHGLVGLWISAHSNRKSNYNRRWKYMESRAHCPFRTCSY